MEPIRLDPALTTPHVSNRIMRSFTEYLEREHGRDTVDAIMRDSGLPRSYVEDAAGWVSSEYIELFTRAVGRNLFGLDELPAWDHPVYGVWRAVGAYALEEEGIGPIFSVVRALGSPQAVYRAFPTMVARANRLIAFDVSEEGEGRVKVRYSSKTPGHDVTPAGCWNAHGFLEAVPTIWGFPRATVRRVVCCHRDGVGDSCTFDVRFDTKRIDWPVLQGLSALGVVVGTTALGLAPLLAALAATGVGFWVDSVVQRRRRGKLEAMMQRDASQLRNLMADSDRRYDVLWSESQALRRALLASRKLSGYLAGDLVDQILENPELELTLGGQRAYAAVLFADIVGFTPRCERMDPVCAIEELNLYFGEVDQAFEAHQGIIDKRMGDGIMAVFVSHGADESKVAGRAVRAGLDMLRAMPKVNAALAERGAEPFEIRVGVAAGQLVQGNMGSPVKLEYTVVGDVPNLAARLESAARPGHVLVSREAFGVGVDGAEEVERSTIRVKGRSEGIDVVLIRPRI